MVSVDILFPSCGLDVSEFKLRLGLFVALVSYWNAAVGSASSACCFRKAFLALYLLGFVRFGGCVWSGHSDMLDVATAVWGLVPSSLSSFTSPTTALFVVSAI